jgi:thiol-disulfide isomerase/thioredoxin
MHRALLLCVLGIVLAVSLPAQEPSDPVAQALSQGDLYQSKHKYELALDAYHKADKLSHHSSPNCYLKIALVERKLGDFSSALDDTKRAVKVAGDNKSVAIQAHVLRATLLSQMASKPTDKKLREAEEELHQALALDSVSAIAHLDLGMVLLKQERDPEGIAELNTFISCPGADAVSIAEARRTIANPIRARAPFAPDFSFTTQENQNISNAGVRGKVVLLDFWGTWCPPCRESVPVLRELNKRYAGKPFQLVGISSDDDEDVWKTFIAAQHMDWAEYIDLSRKVQDSFQIDSYPTYIVLDKDGVIRFRQSGFGGSITSMELDEAIGKALKRAPDPKIAAAMAAESQPTAALNTSSSATTIASSPVKPSVSVASISTAGSAKSDTPTAAPSTGIDGWTVSGNIYKNAALGMSFQFPQNWVAATPDVIRARNERTKATALAAVQQHPELLERPNLTIPKTVFYAARRGDWNGQSFGVPSIHIATMPTNADSIELAGFQRTAETLATASGMKIIGSAMEFLVNKHAFARADFDRTVGALHVYQSHIQTIAGDYLLTIDLTAASPEELQQVAASVQSMTITEED